MRCAAVDVHYPEAGGAWAAQPGGEVGQVTLEAGDKMLFKLAGGSQADPGLTFTR